MVAISPDTLCAMIALEQDYTNYSPAIFLRDAPCQPQHSVDTLYTMMAQDFDYSYCDYLYYDSSCSNVVPRETTAAISHKVTADDRTKIVDWCYSIIDQCQLDRETVAMAMNIVDRFMSNPRRLPGGEISPYCCHQEILYDRTKYQLLVVSALYIAIKINGCVVFSSEELAATSRGIYSKESIEAMERTILDRLSWRVCLPTASQVGCVIFELMIATVQEGNVSIMDDGLLESIREEVTYQTEIAVRDYQLSMQRPSTVAISAILNAIKIDGRMNDCWQELLLTALGDILLHVMSLASHV